MIASLVSTIFVLTWLIFMCNANEGLRTMKKNEGKPVDVENPAQPTVQMQAPEESYQWGKIFFFCYHFFQLFAYIMIKHSACWAEV